MDYTAIKEQLCDFYFNKSEGKMLELKEKVYSEMDAFDKENPNLSSYKLKAKLYDVLAENFEPVFFDGVPFFFETATFTAIGDGTYNRGGVIQSNAWLRQRNGHIFKDTDPENAKIYNKNKGSFLYSQAGEFVDEMHFAIPLEIIFEKGLSSVISDLDEAEKKCKTQTESEFIECARAGINALHKMQLRFARSAKEQGLTEIADMASRVPWNKPETYLEGLCCAAFMRKAIATLEGVGFNSLGRIDYLTGPLYENDLKNGISEETLYHYTCLFLLIWDCHLDRRMTMVGWSDYEYENALTVGGCDSDGNPVFNGATKALLKAQRELCVLYPKFMYRFSASSPKEYLEEISRSLISGRSLGLYENDDCLIEALVNGGHELKDARNYAIGGCWDVHVGNCGKKFGGDYLNILRPLEWAIHQPTELMEANGISFDSYENISSFEEFYEKYLKDVSKMMHHKARVVAINGKSWSLVSPNCAFSALTEGCIENRCDFTAGGSKYNFDTMLLTGFPDVVDSLLAIKNLCFDKKVISLDELLNEVRGDWQNEALRKMAINSPSYGDGSDESNAFASRLNNDLFTISRELPTVFGKGKYHMAHLQYTEIILWGKNTLATPNGRHSGDYITHGITPSRIAPDSGLSEALSAMKSLGLESFSGNAVATLQLPYGKTDSDTICAFLRAAAKAKVQALQLNCVNRDDLLKAQKEPENYGHLIVRICGFSAPFVSLSEKYQDEFLSRNFHDIQV